MSLVIGNQNYDFDEFEKVINIFFLIFLFILTLSTIFFCYMLIKNTDYKGEYNSEHPVIKRFWSIFHQLTIDQKKKFLRELNISFCIVAIII